MQRIRLVVLIAAALAVAGIAQALPRADQEGGTVDPTGRKPVARTPVAPPPAPAPAPAPLPALPDTTALLPNGNYVLVVNLRQGSMLEPAQVLRNGGYITIALGVNESLRGTLDPNGRLHLDGNDATDRLDLDGSVIGMRANGTARLGRGANRIDGSFTLEPVTQARKLQEYGAPRRPPKNDCGFFCSIKKAWSCLTNWASC